MSNDQISPAKRLLGILIAVLISAALVTIWYRGLRYLGGTMLNDLRYLVFAIAAVIVFWLGQKLENLVTRHRQS